MWLSDFMIYIPKTIIIVFLILVSTCLSNGQNPDAGRLKIPSDTVRMKIPKRLSIITLPYLFYSPETKFGVGATSIASFRFLSESPSSKPSSVQIGMAYTQLRQTEIYLPYQIFFGKGNYIAFGDMKYLNYNLLFYGIGNNNLSDFEEKYGVLSPRLKLTVLRKITDGLFLGLRFWREKFQTFDLDPKGQLITGTIPGGLSNHSSSIGVVAWYDTRDNLFFPRKGWFIEASSLQDNPTWFSDFSYNRTLLDASLYIPTGTNGVLAMNFVNGTIQGEAPFQQLNFLGGPKKMRGYYEGRFRSNNIWLAQAEYRNIVFPRFGYTLFADAGSVSEKYGDLLQSKLRYTFGAGLRVLLNKSEKLTARLDIGIGPKSTAVYLTIGEAF